ARTMPLSIRLRETDGPSDIRRHSREHRGSRHQGQGMVIEDGTAWDDAGFGDADSRTFVRPPDALCAASARPCLFEFSGLATATDPADCNYTCTYLVGSVRYSASSDESGQDHDVLVGALLENGQHAPDHRRRLGAQHIALAGGPASRRRRIHGLRLAVDHRAVRPLPRRARTRWRQGDGGRSDGGDERRTAGDHGTAAAEPD